MKRTENTSNKHQRKDGHTRLEMTPHDNSKLVEVWLTKEEKTDPALQAYLREQYRRYAEKKYTVAVFLSGSQDLVEETGALLRHNRRRFAEQEVQRRKKSQNCR